MRAHFIGLAEKGITISQLTMDPNSWIHDHNKTTDISEYLDYPGEIAYKVILQSLKSNLWDATLLNINLPENKSHSVRFTKPVYDLTQFYDYPGTINRTKQIYQYPMHIINKKFPHIYDIGALHEGYISITPCIPDLLNESIYQKLKNKTFTVR
jgi:broad specificity polyphosphatase/5'/3'-nucleotidase SurE